MFSHSLLILLTLTKAAKSFSPSASTANLIKRNCNRSKTSSSRFLVDQAFPMADQLYSLPTEEIKAARAAFALCFFGAAGSASLGREVIPKTWNQWKSTQSLIGSGLGSGGPEMDLFGYPEPVFIKDVQQVLNNNLTAIEIEQEYPGTYQGYLEFQSLVAANPGVSPMAVRAVFDSLSVGINKNQIVATKVERIFDLYRSDLNKMAENIRLGKMIGVGAFFILLGLLGLADYFALYHLLRGW